jgi:hypothetical protein
VDDRDKIIVKNTDQEYVTFNQKFTYLGSIITNDLDTASKSMQDPGRQIESSTAW